MLQCKIIARAITHKTNVLRIDINPFASKANPPLSTKKRTLALICTSRGLEAKPWDFFVLPKNRSTPVTCVTAAVYGRVHAFPFISSLPKRPSKPS